MRSIAIACLLAATAAVGAAAPTPDDAWSRCVAAPVKECVFERAVLNVRAVATSEAHAEALTQLARSELDAGRRTEALRDAQQLYDLALTIDHDEMRQERLSAAASIRAGWTSGWAR